MSTSWIGVFLEGVRSTTYASSEQTKKTTMIIGAVVLVAIMSCWLIPIRSRRQRYIPGVPIFGGSNPTSIKKSRVRFVHDSMSMLLQGYRETHGGPFYVPTKLGERLMLPVKYLEDLKWVPMDVADVVGTFIEMFEGKYTGFGSRSTLHPRAIRGPLNKHLGTVMEHVQDEVKFAFEEVFPPCQDWTVVDAVGCITDIVARISARMFGGTALSRNKEWTQATIDFSMDGFIAAQSLKKYPEWFKPMAARFLVPAMHKVKSYSVTAERAVIPILTERASRGNDSNIIDNDLLSWMTEDAQGGEQDFRFLADNLLKVSFPAIHTSAAATVQLLYDLCAMPEYIEPLCNEVQDNLDVTGSCISGRQGFQNLVKLDSIMKESQRFNPLLLITFERIITKDFPLSDGLVIPKGTTIGIPAHAISKDPSIFPEPDKFNGFRFVDAAFSHTSIQHTEKPTYTGSAAWSAANPESMAFGYGRHACPGRFFASAEIKAIMAYILVNYDFKYPQDKQDRPPRLIFETQNLPNPAGRVLFRRRV